MMVTQEQKQRGAQILARYKATCKPEEIGLFAPEPKPRDASTAGEMVTMNILMQRLNNTKINENKCENIEVK